jgi:HB1, ASXL, restriction endonuclease HTH domain
MTAKKNTTHATARRPHKVPKRKLAQTENRPSEASAPADQVLTAAAETPANPAVAAPAAEAAADATAGSSRIDTPLPAEETMTTTADSSPKPTTPANPLSALDAAAKVLGETGQSLSCPELITAMAAKGYWHSPKGRTPAGTLYSALLRELQTKGDQARFRKTGRGKFALRPTE